LEDTDSGYFNQMASHFHIILFVLFSALPVIHGNRDGSIRSNR